MEILISEELFEAATISAAKGNRAVDEQIELWVKLGMIAESMLSLSEIEELLSGQKQ